MISGWPFQMVWSGYKAVDTFFTISGLLLVTSLLKENFCVAKTSDPQAGPNDVDSLAPASTLTIVESSSKSGETSFNEKQAEESAKQPKKLPSKRLSKQPTKQEAPAAVLQKNVSIFDIDLWNTLLEQGLWKTVTTFLRNYFSYIVKRIFR